MDHNSSGDRRPILAGVDFSPASAAAVAYAAAIARAEQRTLHLIYANSFLLHELSETDDVDEDSLMRRMFSLVPSWFYTSGVVKCHIASGDPAQKILELAGNLQAQSIVAGTHGKRGFNRLALGSVAESLVRLSNTPVIVVGPGVKDMESLEVPWKRIMLASDVDASASSAARLAGELAVEQNAQLTIFYVQPESEASLPEDQFEVFASIMSEESWLKLKPRCLIRGGDLAEQVARMATDSKADILVLSASPANRLAPRFHRGKIAEILCIAPCPVLILRSAAPQRTAATKAARKQSHAGEAGRMTG